MKSPLGPLARGLGDPGAPSKVPSTDHYACGWAAAAQSLAPTSHLGPLGACPAAQKLPTAPSPVPRGGLWTKETGSGCP
jgi:hypothetical protein